MNKMNMKKLLLTVGVLSVILFIYNGFVIFKKNNQIKSLIEQSQYLSQSLSTYEFNDSIRSVIQRSKLIDPELELFSLADSSLKLKDIIDGPKLIIKYSKISCSPCVENEFILIKENLDILGVENIAIITDYDDISQLFRFIRINRIENLRVYVSKNQGLNIISDLNAIPYYFILDKSLSIQSLFVPNRECNEITKRYFRLISILFFKQHNL